MHLFSSARFFDYNFFVPKKFSLRMTERNVLFLIMVPIGTNRKALAFLPLYKRGLGVTPSRWEVKGVLKGDRNRTNGMATLFWTLFLRCRCFFQVLLLKTKNSFLFFDL